MKIQVPLETKCPRCGTTYEIASNEINTTCNCQVCSNSFIVKLTKKANLYRTVFRTSVAFLCFIALAIVSYGAYGISLMVQEQISQRKTRVEEKQEEEKKQEAIRIFEEEKIINEQKRKEAIKNAEERIIRIVATEYIHCAVQVRAMCSQITQMWHKTIFDSHYSINSSSSPFQRAINEFSEPVSLVRKSVESTDSLLKNNLQKKLNDGSTLSNNILTLREQLSILLESTESPTGNYTFHMNKTSEAWGKAKQSIESLKLLVGAATKEDEKVVRDLGLFDN
ncbi:MAG: hypothetical protein WC340_04745 [Kiritimatiellia bacterium]